MQQPAIQDSSNKAHSTPCPVCGNADVFSILDIPQAPVNCISLYPTRTAAQDALQGSISLVFCQHCSHIFNAAFDPALVEYNPLYENSLHFSPRFQEYARDLAAQLIERYDLQGKHVVEIGCGKGEFLTLLSSMAECQGTGFDPSFVADRIADSEGINYLQAREVGAQVIEQPGQATRTVIGRTTFVHDFYSTRYADHPADLIMSRHVLEHIPQPQEFLANLRQTVGDRANLAVFFEVPNADYMTREQSLWDVLYEHCSFFSPGSLAYALHTSGFSVQRQDEVYRGQYLTIEALPRPHNQQAEPPAWDGFDTMARDVVTFAQEYRQKIDHWHQTLAQAQAAGKRIVAWGAGTKGVMFLNVIGLPDVIEYIVDLNPRKQGTYVAGTGQQIIGPEFLREYQPDLVIIMNPIYVDEIREQLRQMGINAECVTA